MNTNVGLQLGCDELSSPVDIHDSMATSGRFVKPPGAVCWSITYIFHERPMMLNITGLDMMPEDKIRPLRGGRVNYS